MALLIFLLISLQTLSFAAGLGKDAYTNVLATVSGRPGTGTLGPGHLWQ